MRSQPLWTWVGAVRRAWEAEETGCATVFYLASSVDAPHRRPADSPARLQGYHSTSACWPVAAIVIAWVQYCAYLIRSLHASPAPSSLQRRDD